jgi:hypothetical protein
MKIYVNNSWAVDPIDPTHRFPERQLSAGVSTNPRWAATPRSGHNMVPFLVEGPV